MRVLIDNFEAIMASRSFDDVYPALIPAMKLFCGHTLSDLVWVALYFNGSADDIGFLVISGAWGLGRAGEEEEEGRGGVQIVLR